MKKALILAAALWLAMFSAAAEPLAMQADLADTVTTPIYADRPEGPAYVYSYAYPQADPSDPSAELINTFYAYIVDDTRAFEIPMNVENWMKSGDEASHEATVSYVITCNNDDFLSVLLKKEEDGFVNYSGHTFSRKNIKPGSSVALPYLLGILESGEKDTWLQDRQTAKADALVRSMVWEMLPRLNVPLWEDLEEDMLEYIFFPEEDFYLDEDGNPVFYLEPGTAADPVWGLLTFPISIEDILDEM